MEHLRPFERRVLAMRDAGVSLDDIAMAFKRSPMHIERVILWSAIPAPAPHRALRPVPSSAASSRCVPRASATTRSRRALRSPAFIRRVEGLAHFRKAMELLG